jgi:hypothetical protein
MSEKDKEIAELKELLESGVPLQHAMDEISKTRSHFTIEEIEELGIRSNTVGGCSLADQYNGCENWRK